MIRIVGPACSVVDLLGPPLWQLLLLLPPRGPHCNTRPSPLRRLQDVVLKVHSTGRRVNRLCPPFRQRRRQRWQRLRFAPRTIKIIPRVCVGLPPTAGVDENDPDLFCGCAAKAGAAKAK